MVRFLSCVPFWQLSEFQHRLKNTRFQTAILNHVRNCMFGITVCWVVGKHLLKVRDTHFHFIAFLEVYQVFRFCANHTRDVE